MLNPYKKYLALIYFIDRTGKVRQYKRRSAYLTSVSIAAERCAITLTRLHPHQQVSVSIYEWNNDEANWKYLSSVEHFLSKGI